MLPFSSKKAKLDEFVLKMPDGYDTVINDKSTNLSGGQKQRIAIARAIIKNSKIILFDEPTSALDKENTEYIKELIDKLAIDKTVIVVSHDMKLISESSITMEEATQLYKYVGKKMIPDRWNLIQKIYSKLGVNAIFKTYEGVGHTPVPATDDIRKFLLEEKKVKKL